METKGTDGMRDLWKRLCSYMDRGLRQQLVFDKFACDAEIEDFLARDYDRGTIEKQRDIYEMNNYFLKTDPLGKSQRISAIYGNNEEVYNFLDPYFQGEDIKRIMIDMGALDRTKLSMFQWQPLQSNFLSRTKKGDVRTDQVITCMRRILHPFTGTWLYTQFFVLEENQIYQLYKASAEEMKGTVYIEEGSHQIQYNDEPYTTSSTGSPGDFFSRWRCWTLP